MDPQQQQQQQQQDDEPAWLKEKRALEARIRELEAMAQQQQQQQQPSQQQPPASSPQAAAGAPPESARMPTPEEITQMTSRLSSIIPESSTDANADLLKHVGTIASNLLRQPYNDPRFRRLRCANPTLQRELLSHVSARPVLCEVLGFHTEQHDGEEVLVLPPSNAAHITLVRTVQASIPRLLQRDEVAKEAAKRFASFRRGVGFALRMEKLLGVVLHGNPDAQQQPPQQQHCADEVDEDDAAVAAPTSSTAAPGNIDVDRDLLAATNTSSTVSPAVRAFVTTALLYSDGDSALRCIELLRKIGDNVARDPSADRVKRLRLTSPVVRDTLLPGTGTVEYLLAVLGFRWCDDGLELMLDASDAAAVRAYQSRLSEGAALLREAEKGAREKKALENEMRRRAALEERENERRQLDAERRAREGPKQPPHSQDSDNTSAATPAAAGASSQGGERIPIAEALRRLMGKDRKDDW